MSVLLIFGLYFYISVCVVVFDLAYVFSQWVRSRLLPHRKETVFQALARQCAQLENGQKSDTAQMKHLFGKLRNIQFLTAFQALLPDLLALAQFEPLVKKNISFFYELWLHYKKRPVEEQAFFSYLLARLPLRGCENKRFLDLLVQEQISLVTSQSVYLSENALKAILALGNSAHILEALSLLNAAPEHLREKLLTDDLLEFAGDHKALSTALWKHFPGFCAPMQVVIVNYLRLLPKDEIDQSVFLRPMFGLIQAPEQSKEVQLAILRYFQKYPCRAMLPVLLRNVASDLSRTDWEFAAVSATALSAYPCKETRTALLQAVKSPNWYLRYNASESLIRLGVDAHELIDHIADRYAKEMVNFRMQVHDLKRLRKEHG